MRLLPIGYALIIGTLCNLAQAVSLSANDSGQVLIYPYFSTRDNNDTLISILNNSDEIKALKVRLLEGEHGLPILVFNLYLAPNDVWAAGITESQNAGLRMDIIDSSCTVPYFYDPQTQFGTVALNFDSSTDSGRDSSDRAREGYLEVIEMGSVSPQGLGANALFNDSIATAPVPQNCMALVDAWDSGGIWANDPQTDMGSPSGNISGDVIFINVPGARAGRYSAAALQHFYQPDGANTAISLHSPPSSAQPDLSAANPPVSQVYVDRADGPQLITDAWPNGVQAVSAALMADEIDTQFTAQITLNSFTETTLTLPTFALSTQSPQALAPFTSTFDEPSAGQGDGLACELMAIDLYNQSGGRFDVEQTTVPIGGIPVVIVDAHLCHAVNVVSYNNPNSTPTTSPNQNAVAAEAMDRLSPLLASRLSLTVADFYHLSNPGRIPEIGRLGFRFNGPGNPVNGPNNPRTNIIHQLPNPTSGRIYHGMPVIAYTLRAATNNNANALFGAGITPDYRRVITEPQ